MILWKNRTEEESAEHFKENKASVELDRPGDIMRVMVSSYKTARGFEAVAGGVKCISDQQLDRLLKYTLLLR